MEQNDTTTPDISTAPLSPTSEDTMTTLPINPSPAQAPLLPTSSSSTQKDEKDRELIRLALQKSPFFACLEEEQIERFIQVAELKRYREGQSIILEGCVDDASATENTVNDDDEFLEGFNDEDNNDNRSDSKSKYNELNSKLQQPEDRLVDDITAGNETMPSHLPQGEEQEIQKEAKPDFDDDATESDQKPQSADSSPTSTDENGSVEKDQQFKNDQDEEPLREHTTPDDPNNATSLAPHDDPNSEFYLEPPPPKSGVPSYIYIVKSGQADVVYRKHNANPASLGTGQVFGEGGFLFGRQHSASVLAASNVLECYVVDAATFRNYVLPSRSMVKLYNRHAKQLDEDQQTRYVTMKDLIDSCLGAGGTVGETMDDNLVNDGTSDKDKDSDEDTPIQDPLTSLRIAHAFNILRNANNSGNTLLFSQRIDLADFCLFHLIMARPDPEVDITFLLIDEHKRGVLYKEDIARFLKSTENNKNFEFDMNSEFIQRHFGMDDKHKRGIRSHQFSQFLVDLRREIGQQAFLQEAERNGTVEGSVPPSNFVEILKTSCGWRLPDGVADRLGSIYHTDSPNQDDTTNGTISQEESNANAHSSYGDHEAPTDLEMQTNEKHRVHHYFSYSDFLAFQEVLGQLPGICNLIGRACDIKKGQISPDDFKVANRVLGMGGSMSRRQVDVIFQLFDLDNDGYISHEDTVAVAGAEVAQRIDAVAGRKGALIFAPPSQRRADAERKESGPASLGEMLRSFSLTSIAGAVAVVALAPLDLVKTRLMNERTAAEGKRMYRNSMHCLTLTIRSEGYLGLYRGLLPQLVGIAPEKAIKLAVNDLVQQSLGAPVGGSKTAIDFLQEMLAGGCAGACQLLVANPVSASLRV